MEISAPRIAVTSKPMRIGAHEAPPLLEPVPEPQPEMEPTWNEENPAATMEIENLDFFYNKLQALHSVTMPIFARSVTALIGPSGCGKSTLLRCMNRMNDTVLNARVQGAVRLLGQDIYAADVNPIQLRRHVGMVFQRSNPFPKSVFDNVAYGIRLHKLANSKAEVAAMVEHSLQRVGLWDEVSGRLKENALNLSGGQQQRLCIARTIAVKPSVILMDEPASALDPIATAKVEELISILKADYTIVIVTHNLQQAGRVSDYTAFFYMGHLVEYDNTEVLFSRPSHSYTENYITGRFG